MWGVLLNWELVLKFLCPQVVKDPFQTWFYHLSWWI